MNKPTCSIESCEREAGSSRGWCNAHYLRHRRYGDPQGSARKPTPDERFWSKVEKSETCWNWTGGLKNGYGQMNADDNGVRRSLRAHRMSFEFANGPIAPGLEIDHICHNRACVNPSHLRAVTHKQNNEHLQGAKASSTSGIRGVFWFNRTKKWVVSVHHHGKAHHVGYFEDIVEAEAAAIAKRIELFTHNDVDRAA